MAKEKLTAAEWELVKDAPLWVNAVLWAGDKKGMAGTDKREAAALAETLKGYRTTNALIRDILNDDSEPADKVKKASKAEAEVALGRIASIVEAKVGADDLDAMNEFLLLIGRNVAGAASENALGLGDKVSQHESAALNELAVLLRATDAQKKARRDNEMKEQAQATAAAKQQADAKAKADKARQEAAAEAEEDRQEAQAKTDQAKKEAEQKERLEKARAEAEARQKESDQKERLEKAREEVEARQKEAQAKREAEEERLRAEAEAKAREEAARVEAEAKAAAEREAAAKQAAAAPRFREFIAEHTVVAGENLSFISQKYYGHQGNFRLIYEANKDVIGDNMSLIRPGQKLRIPKL
jgi:DNA repair exonuclease SbcCD ATPase subunit